MSERRRKVIPVLLLAAAACMILIPGLVRRPVKPFVFAASGRVFSVPEAVRPGGTVSVNSAEAEDLYELYGIGETLAGLIIEEREANGPFYYPEDLTAVKGIGTRKVEQFRQDLDF